MGKLLSDKITIVNTLFADSITVSLSLCFWIYYAQYQYCYSSLLNYLIFRIDLYIMIVFSTISISMKFKGFLISNAKKASYCF